MDRTAWIAIILCVAGLFAWQWWYSKTYMPAAQEAMQQEQPTPAATAPPPGPTPTPAAVEPGLSSGSPSLAPPEIEEVERQVETLKTEFINYEFTNVGGGIGEVILNRHLDKDENGISLNADREIPIGAITQQPGHWTLGGYKMDVRPGEKMVLFERQSATGVVIRKVFTIPESAEGEDDYVTHVEISFENKGNQIHQSAGYYVHLGSAQPLRQKELVMYTGFDWDRNGKARQTNVNWFKASRIPLLGIQTRGPRPYYTDSHPGIGWGAVKNQYFTTILTPLEPRADKVWASRFEVTLNGNGGPLGAIEGALGMPGYTLAQGQSVSHRFELYTGPKEYRRLVKRGQGQEAVLNYGLFKPISLILLNSMNGLRALLGSYAAAILVLTVIIRLLLWPLQNKATQSMKKMSALQPKMTELREKYKDDPTRMNQEMMKLYKQYGINPFGGCLPMLIQIPIFFGFYSMLGSAVELRNSSFLWVKDLSLPDTVFTIGGFPVNILPLLMAATMVLQMKLTPKTGDAIQQRVLMFLPLIFVVFCYNFASALALYWTMQNIVSIFQMYVTRNKPIPALKKAAPPEDTKGRKQTKKRQ